MEEKEGARDGVTLISLQRAREKQAEIERLRADNERLLYLANASEECKLAAQAREKETARAAWIICANWADWSAYTQTEVNGEFEQWWAKRRA